MSIKSVKRSLDEPDAQGLLVIGTESKLCLVLDPTCTHVTARSASKRSGGHQDGRRL